MTRAVLEGVAFSLKDCFGLLEATGLGAVSEARISGGGARGRLWRRILASVLGVALVSLEADEGAALGAALLAGIGAGVWPDATSAVNAGVRLGDRVEPDAADAERYARLYGEYRALYPALRPTFNALSTE